jgi:putative serine protease PepD
VSPGGPAQRAGLRAGDVITRVAGQAVTGPDGLVRQTLSKRAGDQIVVDYVRGGRAGTATVSLGERP